MAEPLPSIPAIFSIDISLNGTNIATIEAPSNLPVNITGGIDVGDIPQIKMELDEDRVRDSLAEVLRAAADQIVGAS
ncbi:hypothetical protein [Tsukamurella tyrosinosolvens]|uniref:hypothetical protein n=1 Tax=Tsukamurella tyrosinosolvens TaxID=57704 RepID=UPI0007B218F7|nr:hypothetical protein [Tsukamurella tyrosinosolvens]KZL96961.1 hypothetical protein AXX05_15890 [Tsukamurella tyrosinosolvens]